MVSERGAKSTVLITGAYGYLGGLLRSRLDREGWPTVALVRRPRRDDRAVGWQLGDVLPTELDTEGATLIHAAYDLRARSRSRIWETNVDGTIALLKSASARGVERTMVLSSMSAYRGTRQLYGRAKLEIERATIAAGGIAVRVGLVYGPKARGMGGTLQRLVHLPVIPVIDGYQFPVHEDDFVDAVFRILGAPSWNPDVFAIAQRERVSFRELLQALARDQRTRPVFVPVPGRLMFWGLRAGEILSGGRLPVRADSILGVIEPARSVRMSANFPELLAGLRHVGGGS